MKAKLVKAFKFCRNVYTKQLLLSNTVSTMVLLGVGDVLTQTIEIKIKHKNTQKGSYLANYDWWRTSNKKS